MPAFAPRVLIVDDDVDLAMALGAELAQVGYRCDLAATGAAALFEVENKSFNAVISDWRMEGMSGAELLGRLAVAKPKLPVIVMTGFPDSRGVDAMSQGAYHYLTKPFDLDELRGVIEQAIGDREQIAVGEVSGPTRNALLPMGTSSRNLLAKIDRLASADAPVLIRGESGSGKELVARAIHERSRRSAAPFLAINVAAIPEQLLESEIFGHVKGAFSGATHARAGLLTKANGGTLLLDEIGEMPLALQAKLLRALQFGEVRPVGSDQSMTVDVRFLAATHRDLQELVKAGSFREDLYFRLHVLELAVPSLRDRKPEIPGLIAHFLAAARVRNPRSAVRFIAPDAMRVLVQAPWPGNVRELASVIERLVVMGETSVMSESDLDIAALRVTTPITQLLTVARDELLSLEELERRYVDWVLIHTDGDKVEAARILGINLSTLYRWKRRARMSRS